MLDSAAVARRALEEALACIEREEAELGRLDAVAGDGDHGAGMVRGLSAAVAAAEGTTASEVLMAAGTAFTDAAGGASGVLFGMAILSAGSSLPQEEISTTDLHAALRASLETVCRMGKSKPGDKTMVDTLHPFVEALGLMAARGESLVPAWSSALSAASNGADSTADMISRRGRSSKLGERSRGHRDPGAVSVLLILEAVDVVLRDSCREDGSSSLDDRDMEAPGV